MSLDVLRQIKTEYERLRILQQTIPGFTYYTGKGNHIILGETHSLGSDLALSTTIPDLACEGVVVVSEGVLNGQPYEVSSAQDFSGVDYRLMTVWQRYIIKRVVEQGGRLVVDDDFGMINEANKAKKAGDLESYMAINMQRDVTLAQRFRDLASDNSVIGVYGNMHVLSPAFGNALGETPAERYVFTGFLTR